MAKEVRPFRFWCQKVLPLVYDDSLSYYELLCKVVDYLNEMRQDVSDLETYLEDYVKNFDVASVVDEKIDEMVLSGYFDTLMIPLFNQYKDAFDLSFSAYRSETNTRMNQQSNQISSLQNQVDALGTLEEGSTTGDAELIGIRTDSRGREFENAGTAVRTNQSDLTYEVNESLKVVGGFTPTYVEDSYITTSGVITADTETHWQRTDYISIDGPSSIFIYQTGGEASSAYNAFYDASKNFISNFTTVAGENIRNVPATAKYMILSNSRTASYVVSTNRLIDYVTYLGKGINNSDDNIFPKFGWKQGTPTQATNKRVYSEKLPIYGHERILIRYSSALYRISTILYDNSNNVVYSSLYFSTDGAETIPNNARYIQFVAMRSDDSDMLADEMATAGIRVTLDQTPNINVNRVRVMSFNIGGFDYGTGQGIPTSVYDEKLANWKKFLMQNKCDIIAIQEFYDYLNKGNTVSSGDVLFNPLYWYNTRGYMNVITYTKMPALNYIDDQYLGSSDESTKRGYTITHHLINNKLVCVANVHLWYVPSDASVRANQISELLTLLAGEKYVIICGDFNAASESEYNAFVSAGYTLLNGGYAGWNYTWNANPAYVGTKYYSDNIIVSSNIVMENFEVLDVFDDLTSDHKPIVADLILE